MAAQDDINLIGALLPVIAAGLAFTPIGAPVGAAATMFTVAEDGIKLEQALDVWLNSPSGAKAKALLTSLCVRLGFRPTFSAGMIKLETLKDVENDMRHHRF